MIEQVKKRSKTLYWALIATFVALYIAVAFVSTLHAVTFFKITNALGLAILLGAAYEVGQATVLFSILMTENKNRILAWLMMFLLTALQITANVYASFKFMDSSGSTDWTFWQRAILFNVQATDSEMYKVIISWISGALLPLVALGMTALVADNIRLMRGEHLGKHKDEDLEEERIEEIVQNEVQKRLLEMDKEDTEVEEAFELLEDSEDEPIEENEVFDTDLLDIQDQIVDDFPWEKDDATREDIEKLKKIASEVKAPEKVKDMGEVLREIADEVNEEEKVAKRIIPSVPKEDREQLQEGIEEKISPSNKMRGWHLMKEYVDDDGNVFSKGDFVVHDPNKTPTSKKA
jgi:hypothetical protein